MMAAFCGLLIVGALAVALSVRFDRRGPRDAAWPLALCAAIFAAIGALGLFGRLLALVAVPDVFAAAHFCAVMFLGLCFVCMAIVVVSYLMGRGM